MKMKINFHLAQVFMPLLSHQSADLHPVSIFLFLFLGYSAALAPTPPTTTTTTISPSNLLPYFSHPTTVDAVESIRVFTLLRM